MKDAGFARQVRRLAFAWIALLALMFSSLGSAYLSLGIGNVVAGIVIAIIKAAIVIALFMRLASASATVRIAAATALATWLLLVALSSIDYAARPDEPAAYQPRQGLRSSLPAPIKRDGIPVEDDWLRRIGPSHFSGDS